MCRLITLACLLAFVPVALAQKSNPALKEQPVLSEPLHAADQARLNRIHQTAGDVLEPRLDAPDAIECVLHEDIVWKLARSTTRAEHEAAQAAVSPDYRLHITAVEALLLEGVCVDGLPEGDFTAVTRFESRMSPPGAVISMQERRHLTGTMRQAKLQDELVFSSLGVTRNSMGGPESRSIGHHILRFEDGVQVGQATGVVFGYDQNGLAHVATSASRVQAPGVVQTRSWTGSMLSGEVTTVDGQVHGWVISYPVQYLSGLHARLLPKGETTRICYQHGKQAGDAACGVATAPHDAVTLHAERPRLRGRDQNILQDLVQVAAQVVPGTQQEFDETSSVCVLSDDAKYAITYGGLAEAYRHRDDLRVEVKLVSGTCKDGSVEGPLEALVWHQELRGGTTEGTITVSRATGEMYDNRHHGRWTSARTISQGNAPDRQTYTVADMVHGELGGPRISFIQGDTLIERTTGVPGERDTEYYRGEFLAERFLTKNGVRDGTSTAFARDSRQVSRCYRDGVMLHEGNCRRR